MGSFRVPGTVGHQTVGVCRVDEGTLVRDNSSRPGTLGESPGIHGLPIDDRFHQVLLMTAPKLPGEVREEFLGMMTPSNLAVMVGVLAAWAGSHYFGVGFVADGILLVGGGLMFGWQAIVAAEDLAAFIRITYTAQTCRDLDRAAQHLANFIAVVGVGVLMAVLMKGAKGQRGGTTANARANARRPSLALPAAAKARRAGLPMDHYEVFSATAQLRNEIIVVRYTNRNSLQWIERGFPAKPMEIKIKTDRSTGIVTAIDQSEIDAAQRAGYHVLGADGVARGPFGRTIDLAAEIDWPATPGQIIHPTRKKPLVGDYDLLAVIDPAAPGRNIALATNRGRAVANRTNPRIESTRRALNELMDQERVMHGAHDSYGDLPSAISKTDDGAIVFWDDGQVELLDELGDAERFYRELPRQTIVGKYNAVTPGAYSPTP